MSLEREPGTAPRRVIAATGLVVCLLLAQRPLSAQTGPVVARASSVAGAAWLSTGGAQPFALTRGYLLNPGDQIDTRGGGRVTIDLSDGSMVIVQPESVLILKDYRQASSLRELFQITLGQVRVKINHFAGKPNPYRMNSPTASIAVRGTEFTVTVDASGATQVDVIEGAVEVWSLNDPTRSVLIEAGRGVLVTPGQGLRLIAAGPAGREGGDNDRRAPDRRAAADIKPPQIDSHPPQEAHALPPGVLPPGADTHAPSPDARPPTGPRFGPGPMPDHDAPSPRAAAGTYERYVAALSEIGQVPFLLRFNAFAESHLDSLENPAMAGQFRSGEMRFTLLPSLSGVGAFADNTAAYGATGSQPATYTLAPQASLFLPLGHGWIGGASATGSSIDSGVRTTPIDASLAAKVTGSNFNSDARSRFFSGSLLVAKRMGTDGRSSVGFGVEALRGTGSSWNQAMISDDGQTRTDRTDSTSEVRQTRLTAGAEHAFAGGPKLGVFYRYGLIDASDADRSHTIGTFNLPLESTSTGGHSSEIGLRLRGAATPRLFYGVTASWLGLSLNDRLIRTFTPDGQQRDRAQRGTLGLGLGYLLGRRTVLSFDLAGGTSSATVAMTGLTAGGLLQTGQRDNRFLSAHTAVQSQVWRGLFLTGSILGVRQRFSGGITPVAEAPGRYAPLVTTSFLPLSPSLAPTRASDFGVGWRFSRDFFAQYVFSTDYGTTSSSHTLMLRYTFHFHNE